MFELALYYREGQVLLKDIASSQGISERYLGNLIIPLKGAGLIGSVQGAHGGYFLAKKPGQITLLELVQLLEGHLGIIDCLDDQSYCDRESECPTKGAWQGLQDVIDGYLGGITLADLVESHQKQRNKEHMYFI